MNEMSEIFGRNCPGLVEVVYRHLAGGTVQNNEQNSIGNRYSDGDSNPVPSE
jgi:hypothetical protein